MNIETTRVAANTEPTKDSSVSLRDQFAIACVGAIIQIEGVTASHDYIARQAYRIADQMMKARRS